MRKTIIALAILLSSSVAIASNDQDRDIHGRHFKGDIRLPKGYGHASDNGDQHASNTGNEHGIGHQNVPAVPLPASLWMMMGGMFGLLGVARRSKTR